MAMRPKGEIDHAPVEKAILKALRERRGKSIRWKPIREQFPDISMPTLSRMRDAVRRKHPELTVKEKPKPKPKKRRKNRQVIEPPPKEVPAEVVEPVALPTRSGANISLLQKWHEVAEEVETSLRCFKPPKPGEKPVHPRYYLDSLTLKAKIVTDLMKAMRQLWNIDRIQFLYDTIVKHLRDRDPELAKAVLADIELSYREAGITIDSVRM